MSHTKKERNKAIYIAVQNGISISRLAEQMGISRQAVDKIWLRELKKEREKIIKEKEKL